MTVSQLYNSVAQLGFEDSLEEDDRFIFAANRALLQDLIAECVFLLFFGGGNNKTPYMFAALTT